MKKLKITSKIIDFDQALEELKVPVLYRYHNATLEVGRSARLLETIRGQGEVEKTTLYDYASEFGYNPDYVEKILIPRYVDWGFLSDDENSVHVEIDSQKYILSKCGDYWLKREKSKRDELAIKAIVELSKRPIFSDTLVERVFRNASSDIKEDVLLTLDATNMMGKVEIDGKSLLYSPYIVGDKVSNLEKIFRDISEKELQIIEESYNHIAELQGCPLSSLTKIEKLDIRRDIIDSCSLAGIFNPCEVNIGHRKETYLFTGDILSEGSKETDTFHTVKETVAHFRHAELFASYRLRWLPDFLRALLRNGEAGRASPIGTDYKLLERRGIIKVKRLGLTQRYRMYLVDGKEDIIRKTLDIIESGAKPIPPITSETSLRDELEKIKIPPEARTTIDSEKVSELMSRFIEKLRRA